ncbi:MAG: ABC transporter permease [Myxococcales bacterium]|nr:ABC transporter permease [Myxococcales bacterium]
MALNLRTSFLAMAARNLLRNGWRSGLTAGGIALSVAMMIWTVAMMDGFVGAMVNGATAVELGQLQIHRADYAERARAERSFPADAKLIAAVTGVPGVEAVSPRVKLWGLMGNEKRSRVTRIVGVDAAVEAEVTPVAKAAKQGKWLSAKPDVKAAREVVLGEGLARQLGVKVGSEVVAFLQATDGSLGNDVFTVRGIVTTGNQLIDRSTAFVHLGDAQYLGALDGQLHELAIKAKRPDDAEQISLLVQKALEKSGQKTAKEPLKIDPDEQDLDAKVPLLVRPWGELTPDLYTMVQMSDKSTASLYFIIYLIAILSIVNTQRMSAWERRREFGVMVAIGLSPRRLFRLVLSETLLLALVGALLGAVLGTAISQFHATYGFDMSMFTDQGSFSYMGVAFTERIYFELRPDTIMQPTLVMLVVGTLAGLWPAFKAMRLQPAATIAGRS